LINALRSGALHRNGARHDRSEITADCGTFGDRPEILMQFEKQRLGRFGVEDCAALLLAKPHDVAPKMAFAVDLDET
jgi:hypothetical protein